MLLKRKIQKTKSFIQRSVHNVKSYVFGGYQKLSRSSSMNFFSCRINNPKLQQLDDFYGDFCQKWEPDLSGDITPRKSKSKSTDILIMKDENACSKTFEMDPKEEVRVVKKNEEKKAEMAPTEDKKGSLQSGNNGLLAKKMRELEMMDVHDDADHVHDVEEVLHYYSRLKSPVYQDLVDKFFIDMYSDFSFPKPFAKPTNINTSSRRLAPLKI